MARRSRLQMLVDEALVLLDVLGIPMQGLTKRRKEKMAKAFLSVAGMKPGMAWVEAKDDNRLRSREIINWMNEHLQEQISPGSYDDIRRKDLLLPIEAGLVLRSAGNADAATNDGTRSYALSPEVAIVIRTYGSAEWLPSLLRHLGGRNLLKDQLSRAREQNRIPINIGGKLFDFGPGEHNQLQRAVIEEFLPRFGKGAEVLYVGDTEDKLLFLLADRLAELGFFRIAHDKLPDVLAFSADKNWIYLVEAVHSANPITEMRKLSLEQLTAGCRASIVFVTAFLTRADFRKFAKDIAWETEVWIAESPDHLIHFNGDKFLGPHVLKK